MEFALGEMGLSPHQFYCMTPAEFYLASKGFVAKEHRKWEHTRLLAYTVASTVPSKKKMPPIKRWMPLPTDGDEKEVANEDQILKLIQKVKDADSRTE